MLWLLEVRSSGWRSFEQWDSLFRTGKNTFPMADGFGNLQWSHDTPLQVGKYSAAACYEQESTLSAGLQIRMEGMVGDLEELCMGWHTLLLGEVEAVVGCTG